LTRQAITERPVEIETFVRLLRANSVLRRELEAEVLSPRGLTINDFETLFHLYRAEEQRLRRVDLVGLLMLTPSGVTRLLDGLQAAGLVENRVCQSDARVVWATLTDEGRDTLECVRVEHTGVLRSLFRGALTAEEVAQLAELLGKLPGVGPEPCAGGPEAG
jgi:DNA-binding MarR family transcriptional regulator